MYMLMSYILMEMETITVSVFEDISRVYSMQADVSNIKIDILIRQFFIKKCISKVHLLCIQRAYNDRGF